MIAKLVAGSPETIMPNCLAMMVAGILGCCVAALLGGLGILTFVQVATLGVSAAALYDYQHDRGLWMLALLMLLIWSGLHILGVTMELRDMLRGVQPPIVILLDASLATFCTMVHIRFLWRVTRYNFYHV